ncbi:MAG TPA: hypothetical protein VHO25_24680 [Polyangiaceae bacterium]|nr:hypothetical protein [Polyangiaceae bacterium]
MPQRWALWRRNYPILASSDLHCRIPLFALAPWALACDGVAASAVAPSPDASVGDPLYGSIVVSLRETTESKEAYGLVSGTLYDAPRPNPEPMRVALEEGGCQLREAIHPFCNDPCGSAAACVSDDQCLPYPTAQDVGNITISGLDLDTGSTTLEPFAPSFFYQSDELAYPPCQTGASLHLESTAFTAQATCIAPLIVDTHPVRVRTGEPVSLTWDTTESVDPARIQILLDISHHGGKRGDILCDVPDSGSYTIPQNMVTALVDLGLAGFPSVILTRRSTGTTTPRSGSSVDDVTFIVAATVERPVDTGVHSCLRDEDCPDGETCDRQTVTCR